MTPRNAQYQDDGLPMPVGDAVSPSFRDAVADEPRIKACTLRWVDDTSEVEVSVVLADGRRAKGRFTLEDFEVAKSVEPVEYLRRLVSMAQ